MTRSDNTPNFTGDEIDLNELRSAADGDKEAADDQGELSVGVSFVLIISICGAAASVGPCAGNTCGGNA